jgi:hypothetical protein
MSHRIDEHRTTVTTVMQQVMCEKCDFEMLYLRSASEPTKYVHWCAVCNAEAVLPRVYPYRYVVEQPVSPS